MPGVSLAGLTVTLLGGTSPCWFGLASSTCYYNLHNPPSFFSLGEAVGAFGLIFAVFQLRSRGWRLSLVTRNWLQRNLVWIFGGLGLLMIFLSVIITQVPPQFLQSPFDYPLFYELLGFLFFVAAPAALYLTATKIGGLFTPKRAGRFYSVLHSEIARGGNEAIEYVIDAIAANLDAMCKSLPKIPRIPGPQERTEQPARPSSEEQYAGYANAILTVILGDEKVARYVATSNLDFIRYLISTFSKYGVTRDHTRLGVERILEFLFTDPHSHLHMQLDYRGMSLSANIYKDVFGNPAFLSGFDPFSSAYRWADESQLDELYIKVYLKALEEALNGYWENSCPLEMKDAINRGFRQLNDYSKYLASACKKEGRRDAAMSRLNSISFFLGHTFFLAYHDALEKQKVSTDEKNAVKYDEFNHSVTYAYAESVAKYLEALASVYVPEMDEQVGLSAITATQEMIGVTVSPNDQYEPVRKQIIDLIWGQISGESMSNAEGFFPPVLRVYISLVGFKVGGDNTVSAIERIRLIKFLEEKIKPKILNGELMKNNKDSMEEILLPSNVVFDRQADKFKYQMSGGEYQEMDSIIIASQSSPLLP